MPIGEHGDLPDCTLDTCTCTGGPVVPEMAWVYVVRTPQAGVLMGQMKSLCLKVHVGASGQPYPSGGGPVCPASRAGQPCPHACAAQRGSSPARWTLMSWRSGSLGRHHRHLSVSGS